MHPHCQNLVEPCLPPWDPRGQPLRPSDASFGVQQTRVRAGVGAACLPSRRSRHVTLWNALLEFAPLLATNPVQQPADPSKQLTKSPCGDQGDGFPVLCPRKMRPCGAWRPLRNKADPADACPPRLPPPSSVWRLPSFSVWQELSLAGPRPSQGCHCPNLCLKLRP